MIVAFVGGPLNGVRTNYNESDRANYTLQATTSGGKSTVVAVHSSKLANYHPTTAITDAQRSTILEAARKEWHHGITFDDLINHVIEDVCSLR